MDTEQFYLSCGEVLTQSACWLRDGHRVAIATVVATWGSSPRPVGSQMAVNERGLISGSVSGGCIESALVGQAMTVMECGQSQRLVFGVSDDKAWEVGLACGGRVEVYLEQLRDQDLLERLLQLRADKVSVALVHQLTAPASGWNFVCEQQSYGRALLPEATLGEIRQLLARGCGAILGGKLFVNPLLPPLRLIIVGGVHIAQALTAMAKLTGYEVIIVDPRPSFASNQRFPGVELVHQWPDEAFCELELDCRSAVVVLTHDPKIDDPALVEALRYRPFYLGALGSYRTHYRRLERLREAGVSQSDLARICAPVGLPIGARQPAEIAISIMAEMTAALRQGSIPEKTLPTTGFSERESYRGVGSD